MAAESNIEWTDATWNPTRGCTRVSPGCENCYAEVLAGTRLSKPGQAYHGFAVNDPKAGPRWTRKVALVPDMLDGPLHWKKPRRIFVNSMSDLFHESLPDAAIEQVFAVMANCPQHTFQVLTKRAERMAKWFATEPRSMNVRGSAFRLAQDGVLPRSRRGAIYNGQRLPDVQCDTFTWPLPNVWIGVSVEDQQRADERIPHLLRVPAAVRFLSCEPLLGPVDLTPHLFDRLPLLTKANLKQQKNPFVVDTAAIKERALVPSGKLHWVIVGGESGAGARPMRIEWARDLVKQCKAAGVATFVKQLGAVPMKCIGADDNGLAFYGRHELKLDKTHGGDPREWPSDLNVREFPEVRHV